MSGLYSTIVAPSKVALHRLELRGLPLDAAKRDEFRAEAQERMDKAKTKLTVLTKEFHDGRLSRINEEVVRRQGERDRCVTSSPCEKHPEYKGITNRSRSKCEGCRGAYGGAELQRAEWKRLGAIISRGKALSKQLGPTFKSTSDDHWRTLLFDTTIGCKLRPMGRTKVKKVASVKDETIDKLRKRYPDNPFLSLRVDIQETKTRLSTRLAVEPAEDGCVHFAYHVHRSGPGRVSSGKDDEEVGKFRSSAANAQNITHRDRAIYSTRMGEIFVAGDASQIEARVMATLAGELKMLRAWEQGLDIHAINGAALARALGVSCSAGQADEKVFRFAGETRTYRYAAKRMTHGWNYGMHAELTAELFGLSKAVAQRLIDAYFATWPVLREFQQELVARAARDRLLVNSFGRVFRFWAFKRDKEGRWTLADPNEAISFPAQSDVADMCKALLPTMDKIARRHGGTLRHTEHDSFLSVLADSPHVIDAYIQDAREAMEREWPQLPERLGKTFSCPADFKVGRRWADWHEHNGNCPPDCSQLVCPDGLRKAA